MVETQWVNPSLAVTSSQSTDDRPLGLTSVALALPVLLTACGGGGGDSKPVPAGFSAGSGSASSFSLGLTVVTPVFSPNEDGEPAKNSGLNLVDAARFLTQATFGIRSIQEITDLQNEGLEHWLWRQFRMPYVLQTSYLDAQRSRNENGRASDDMSYEAIWRQWLFDEGQLRARMAFALSEIMVISNIAPDIRPYAMSSYLDLLNQHAFGNYRDLLKAVTLHPAMGYYLNMTESEKENPDTGTHPNENYAREVLQLFSIGLIKLNRDGSPHLLNGKSQATYSEDVVKGFARAFSGWSFGGQNPAAGKSLDDLFNGSDEDLDTNWTTPLRAYPDRHEPGTKLLLDGLVLSAGKTPEKDMDDAIDCIFHHPNVGPFIGRQLIQRFVTSNPSVAYIDRVASAFNDNGKGTRGDLRAVLEAVLLDPDARNLTLSAQSGYGKLREPVIRLAQLLRAFQVTSSNTSGRNDLHYLDNPDDSLGQSPLLAPSVFNFFSPNYRHPGAIAQAGLVAPEFQITTEISVVGYANTMANFLWSGAYGWRDESRLTFNWKDWDAVIGTDSALLQQLDMVFCCGRMSTSTRTRLLTMIQAFRLRGESSRNCLQYALNVLLLSPDFVVQK